jgi:DNA polymerase-3 subunit gamma/tau
MRYGGAEEFAITSRASAELGLETTLAAIGILDQTLTRMRQSTHVRTLVEIALVRICRLENLDALSGLIADLKSGAAPAGANPTRGQHRPAAPAASKKNIDAAPLRVKVSANPAAATPTSAAIAPLALETAVAVQEQAASRSEEPAINLEADTASEAWRRVVARLHDDDNLLASHAERSAAVSVDDAGCLVVSFTPQTSFDRSRCEKPDARQQLETCASQIVGRPVRLRFDTAQASPTPIQAAKQPTPREQQQAIADHPLVRRAGELFAAEVVGPPRRAK